MKSTVTTQRYKAVIIFLIPFLVLVSSTIFFYSGFSPEGRMNKGELIDPPINFDTLDIEGPETGYLGSWIILHFLEGPCETVCWNSLYKTRQVNIRLGKDSSRLVRLLVFTDQSELSKENLTKLATEYPRLMVQKINKDNSSNNKLLYMYKGSYVLFDPLGNGILLYRSNLTGGELLEDLKKLLKNSKIG